jgi:Protein of unknown function (DUF541)
MRVTGRARWCSGIIAITVLMAGVVWVTRAASAQSSPPVSSPPVASGFEPNAHLAGAGKVIAGRSSAVASWYPVGCCAAASPLGVTTTGQATVRAAGSAARASAIARAVADAANQAKAAASAAGISLGRIIDMQVSAPYYPHPLPPGAAAGRAACITGAPGATGAPGVSASAGAGTPAVSCPDLSQCPGYPCVSTYASVTITWAIA